MSDDDPMTFRSGGSPPRASRWAPLAWAAVAAGVGAWMAPLEPSFLEEGLMLHVAERLVGGEHLYRDVLAVTGPVPYELLAASFRIFGEDVAVARALVVLLQSIATLLVFDWARRTGVGALAHAAAAVMAVAPVLLFPLYTLFFYTTIAYPFCVFAGYAALRASEASGGEREEWLWGAASGVAIAVAALCKQTLGVALVPALLIVVAACAPPGQRVRRPLAVVVGGGAITLAVLAFYGARGELAMVIDALVVRPFSLGETYASPYMNLWPIGEFSDEVRANRLFYLPQLYNLYHPSVFTTVGREMIWLTQAVFALPLLALGVTGIRRCFTRLRAGVWIQAALLVALFSNLFPRADWGHLVVVLPGAMILLIFALSPRAAAGAMPRSRSSNGARACALAIVGVFGVGAFLAGSALHSLATEPNLGPRVSQRPVSVMTRNAGAARVVDFLSARVEPGEPIFVARSEPLLYFATGTTNPTPFGGVITGHQEEQEAILLPALESVRFVVMSDRDQPLYTYYSDEVPAVQALLERHFEVAPPFVGVDDRETWIFVLQRGADRGETLVDFFDQRERGRYWVRSTKGREEPHAALPPRLAGHYNRRPLSFPLGLRGGGVDFDVTVPEAAVFQGDVGLRGMTSKDDFFTHPPKSQVHFAIRAEGASDFERLHTEGVLQGRDVLREGKFWTPVEIDLSPWAGQRVTLRMELETPYWIEPGTLSWVGSPRLVRGRESL